MKKAIVILAMPLFAGAASQAAAEEYQGVLRHESNQSRHVVQAEARAATRASNPYAEGASSGVATALISPRDRAEVEMEARTRARAANQNLRAGAFFNSRIPTDFGGQARPAVDQAASKARVPAY
ncbi:alpha/beta hydrolase [Variovorax paradoxus]|uniref:alpha/beta hydrolase n=1 Tax=Variovorax paradoxus TaxID=34073 RepID=UPI0019326226|nr:alpha/beta hydrolase [Variovorax paradoxus]